MDASMLTELVLCACVWPTRNSTKHSQGSVRRGLNNRHLDMDHRPVLKLSLGRIHSEARLKPLPILPISVLCM